MAAPDRTRRCSVFVNKVGTDDAGYNTVGHPESRLTIAAALADLLANYPTPSASNPCTISVGPGYFIEILPIQIPPWVWIVGSPDADSSEPTIVELSGVDITLSSAWSANVTARGGLSNLVIRGSGLTPDIDLTMPAPSAGNPSRTVEIDGITTDLDNVVFEATSTADALRVNGLIHDGTTANDVRATGGSVRFNNCVIAAATTIASKAGFSVSSLLTSSRFATLAMNQVTAAFSVSADVLSLATVGTLTTSGTVAITRITDANGLGYTPAVSGNWPVGTDTVQKALDAVGGGGGATGFFKAADGSATTPSYSFLSDTDTGLYWNSSGVMSYSGNGARSLNFGPNGAIVGANVNGVQAINLPSTGAISLVTEPNQNLNLSPGGTGVTASSRPILLTGDRFFQSVNGGSTWQFGASASNFVITEGGVANQLTLNTSTGNALFNGTVAIANNDTKLARVGVGQMGFNLNSVAAGFVTNIGGSGGLDFRAQGSNQPINLLASGTAGTIINGTGTNDSAAAGKVGEFISSTVASGSAVSLTTGTPANVTSISLTAGDWDVRGVVYYKQGAATTVTYTYASISSVSATVAGLDGSTVGTVGAGGNAVDWAVSVPSFRVSVSATTTIYLVAQSGFAVSTSAAYGAIAARRVR